LAAIDETTKLEPQMAERTEGAGPGKGKGREGKVWKGVEGKTEETQEKEGGLIGKGATCDRESESEGERATCEREREGEGGKGEGERNKPTNKQIGMALQTWCGVVYFFVLRGKADVVWRGILVFYFCCATYQPCSSQSSTPNVRVVDQPQ
jgi:hypothetical protein